MKKEKCITEKKNFYQRITRMFDLYSFFFVLCIFLSAVPVFAREAAGHSDRGSADRQSGDFWICPGAETALYSLSSPAYGGSISLGYGRGASIGFKVAYLLDAKGLNTLELNFLLRWYFLERRRYSGLFVQLAGGPVFFAPDKNNVTIPAEYAAFCAGLNLGWRFLLGNRWFIEPNIRAGYPYVGGIGLSAGFHY